MIKMDRKEIRGWFSQPNEDALAKLIEEHEIKTVIEIGTFLGASAAFFAEKCDMVYCVDPFVIWPEFIIDNQPRGDLAENFFHQFHANMIALGIEEKVFPIISTSSNAARMLPLLKADLVYIDGAHDLASVISDIGWWKQRANKIICGDDHSVHWPEVEKAVHSSFSEYSVLGDSLWVKKLI